MSKKNTPKAIIDARTKINKIDVGILDLLKKRIRLAQEIGQHKNAHGLDVNDVSRERELLRMLIEANGGDIPDEKLLEIWGKIIELSKTVQDQKH
ncbi:MAG TPA: chorismate mutase [Candidatus Gracilibacteria bacterium]